MTFRFAPYKMRYVQQKNKPNQGDASREGKDQ